MPWSLSCSCSCPSSHNTPVRVLLRTPPIALARYTAGKLCLSAIHQQVDALVCRRLMSITHITFGCAECCEALTLCVRLLTVFGRSCNDASMRLKRLVDHKGTTGTLTALYRN